MSQRGQAEREVYLQYMNISVLRNERAPGMIDAIMYRT
jgi:hypothetical protein